MNFKLLLLITLFIGQSLFAIKDTGSVYYKEKEELLAVKDELNEFYETKELEYQKNKAELAKIKQEILKAEKNIKKAKEDNEKTLQEIKREITSKAMNMYDKMKLGVVVNIFNEMIDNGEIDEVFDIMIRMKEKRVMKILKKFDTKTSTLLMKKMRILKESKKEN